MKNAKNFVFVSLLGVAAITCSVVFAFANNTYLKSVGDDNSISSGVLTFDKSHTSVTTAHGNTVSLIATGVGSLGGSYLFSINSTNSTGYLRLSSSTPIQKIEKVTFSYTIHECFEYYFYAGETYGSTTSSTSLEGLTFDVITKTVTITAPFVSNNYHFFTIKYGGMDSQSYCRITSLSVTYSCSY